MALCQVSHQAPRKCRRGLSSGNETLVAVTLFCESSITTTKQIVNALGSMSKPAVRERTLPAADNLTAGGSLAIGVGKG